jgi:hypothetical protein
VPPTRGVARLNTASAVDADFACTIATSAWATSRGTTVCAAPVSPAIGAQPRPFALQRSHW